MTRFLLYSHDGVGLGHIRRNAAIASALTDRDPDASVLLATGVDQAERFVTYGNVEVLKLPGIRKDGDSGYVARRLGVGRRDVHHLRAALLEAAVGSFRPSVLLADKHPVGPRGELRPALRALRRVGGRAVLGLRDILDDRASVLKEWHARGVPELIAAHYDEVLVYGDRRVLDPVREYELPRTVAGRTRFCGYVVDRPGMRTRGSDTLVREGRRPLVLATAGGGEDGFAIIDAFIRAAASSPWKGIAVSGPLAEPDARERLARTAAEADVEFHEFVWGLTKWFGQVDALVCLGGYNTLTEAVSGGTPTVCVPRESPRAEQVMRARALERLSLLRVVARRDVTPACIAAEVAAALASPAKPELARRAHAVLDFDGARRAAERLLALAVGPKGEELRPHVLAA